MAGEGSTPSGLGQRESVEEPPPANSAADVSPATPKPMAVVFGSTKPAPWYGVSTHPWMAAPSDGGPQNRTLWLWSSPTGHRWGASSPWAQYGSPAAWKAASHEAWFWGPTESAGLVATGARSSPNERR